MLWTSSLLQLCCCGAGLSRERFFFRPGAVSAASPSVPMSLLSTSLQAQHPQQPQGQCPPPGSPTYSALLDATGAGWASHCYGRKEIIINKKKNNFEISRWERAELSACFYGAPREAPVPSGCHHRPFPEGDFFPSPCREAAAPSPAPGHFQRASHALSSTAELCHGLADGHPGAGQSWRKPQHRWRAGAMPWDNPLAWFPKPAAIPSNLWGEKSIHESNKFEILQVLGFLLLLLFF